MKFKRRCFYLFFVGFEVFHPYFQVVGFWPIDEIWLFGGGGGCRDGVICGEDSATTIVLKERMRGVRIRAMILLVAKGAGRELVFAIVLGYDDGETVVGEEGVGGPVDMVGVIVEGVRLKGRTPPLGLV
ncbi:hypothetical protein GYH30_054931 [Glycine max]|nr:hypothetical protein GYH30_054931 [Glycine max]